jgi:hypothetical protein
MGKITLALHMAFSTSKFCQEGQNFSFSIGIQEFEKMKVELQLLKWGKTFLIMVQK